MKSGEIMGWSNDELRIYKNKYEEAYLAKAAAERRRNECIQDRNIVLKDIEAENSEKKNAEKRLRELYEIIKLLNEDGGWFSSSVPEAIEESNQVLNKADKNYSNCIKCIGVTAASIAGIFKVKKVEEDSSTSQALEVLRNEAQRLEQRIEDAKSKIIRLTAEVEEYRQKINRYSDEISIQRSRMNSALYNMLSL